nr:helix-turn-helix domain-containing protein [Lachnospiraceae bacterium]
MDKEKTGQMIKEARTKKGYTQSELGDILGVSNKAVSRWEKGESFPDVGVLENLSVTLDIGIEELI